MKYIKVFDTHNDYEDYINTSTKILPNLSYCNQEYETHITDEPYLFVYYYIENNDIDNPIKLYDIEYSDRPGADVFEEDCFIDEQGESISNIDDEGGCYYFYEEGINVAKFLLKSTTLSYQLFLRCSKIVKIVIPKSVTHIEDELCNHCISLTDIIIPNSITYIDSEFCAHTNLTSLVIPESVTYLSQGSFYNNSNLQHIEVNYSNPNYDSRYNCNAIIETSTNTLITGCRNTVIPDNITTIGDHAFRGCGTLTNIIIPESVTNIGSNTFQDCSTLINVTILATTPPVIGAYTFDNNAQNRKLYVPTESVELYKATSGWIKYKNDILAIN